MARLTAGLVGLLAAGIWVGATGRPVHADIPGALVELAGDLTVVWADHFLEGGSLYRRAPSPGFLHEFSDELNNGSGCPAGVTSFDFDTGLKVYVWNGTPCSIAPYSPGPVILYQEPPLPRGYHQPVPKVLYPERRWWR